MMIAHGEVLSRPMQRVVCSRRVSLSSESVFNCDEQCVLPLTYVISNDDVKTENEHIHSASVSDQHEKHCLIWGVDGLWAADHEGVRVDVDNV